VTFIKILLAFGQSPVTEKHKSKKDEKYNIIIINHGNTYNEIEGFLYDIILSGGKI
jgi:hypothetical protein